MTSTCQNCEHEKRNHEMYEGICIIENCACKRFQPQSPQSSVETPHKKQNVDTRKGSEEQNLSEKIQDRKKAKPVWNTRYTLDVEDVKKAVADLKEELGVCYFCGFSDCNHITIFKQKINKIFGKELLE